MPGDLVDALYAQHGFGIIGQSGRVATPAPFRWRGEVPLTNLARNRWDLKTDFRRGSARGNTVPYRNIVDPQAALMEYPKGPRIDPRSLLRSGGSFCRVDELVSHLSPSSRSGRAPEVHWCLARRYVQARVDTNLFEKALPALAAAIGGRYIDKKRMIDIDPVAFRSQALATLRGRLSRTDDYQNRGSIDDLMVLVLESMTDKELLSAYDVPNKATYIKVPNGFRNVRLTRYIGLALTNRDQGGNGSGDYIRANMDFDSEPLVQFTPTGGIGVAVKKKGSETRMVF